MHSAWLCALALAATAGSGCASSRRSATSATPTIAWHDTEPPLFGLIVAIPETWSVNDAGTVVALLPLPPADEGAVIARLVPEGAARSFSLDYFVPVRDVKTGVADGWEPPPGTTLLQAGTAIAGEGDAIEYLLLRVQTGAGTVVVAAVMKLDASPAARETVKRIVASLRVSDGDLSGDERDLAGRPL